MCLITFHYNEHPNYPLIVVTNRDEFYERPTAQAHFWEDNPAILAGRDLSRLGTWLGITKTGRFAALTNYREPGEESINKKSRGDIIRNFLTADGTTAEFMEMLEKTKDQYAGFNLIAGRLGELVYFSNRQDGISQIPAGTHGLSNHLLNTPWPKVVKGKTRLRKYVLQQEELETDSLFKVLSDETPAPDEELPNTGVELELERQLSSQFIKLPHYGTRSSTVLLIDSHQSVTFVERTYVKGSQIDERKFHFQVMEKIH
jgi:uncharacterized protein with NRDE domain